jgi:hypothetical protein
VTGGRIPAVLRPVKILLTTSTLGGFAGSISPNPTLPGWGLGQNDAVLLLDPSGNFVSGVNYGTTNITVTSLSGTSTLAQFSQVGGGTSAGGHEAVAGGGGAATQSVISDPFSDPIAPLDTAASSVGLYCSFEAAVSTTTIGAPSIVTEPSTVGFGVLGFAGVAARRRPRMA